MPLERSYPESMPATLEQERTMKRTFIDSIVIVLLAAVV
jgi:hypothetical protein